jgi:hypothetical protein
MKINGTILEDLNIVKGGEKTILQDENSFYLSKNGELINIYKKKHRTYSATYLLDGLWLSDNDKKTTDYIDIFNNGKSYKQIPYAVAELTTCNNYLIASTSVEEVTRERIRRLVLVNLETGIIQNKAFVKGLKYSTDGEYVYTRSDYEKLVECYNYKLEKVWEYSNLEGQAYIDFERLPQIHQNLLIINHAFDTIALNKKTGEEVWKHTFEDIPTSNVLMDEKIYAVCKARLYVINPENGAVLQNINTGYPEYLPDIGNPSRDKNHIGVFPVNNYLYSIASYQPQGKLIHLYNKNYSKILSSVSFPDYYLNRSSSICPTIRGRTIFQRVRNGYAYSTSGLLMLDIAEHVDSSIKVGIRPSVIVMASPSLKESHKLQMFLNVDNLDDAMRFGYLFIQELLYATSYYRMYDMRKNALDRKHNGHVELIVNTASFDDSNTNEHLDSLELRINKSIDNGLCVSGDKQTPIQFSLVKQPKNEWSLNGERLEWPAMRDLETPIS